MTVEHSLHLGMHTVEASLDSRPFSSRPGIEACGSMTSCHKSS